MQEIRSSAQVHNEPVASAKARRLALEVASCPDMQGAYGTSHACSGVVEWQREQFQKMEVPEDKVWNRMHRPEAWAGNLETAKVVWLSSNPSFSDDESFPTWDPAWSSAEIEDFVVHRFSKNISRGYGAGDEAGVSWDKPIKKDGSLFPKRVATWRELRSRTAIILQKPVEQVDASRDYVMTEVVHCKSPGESGLSKACVVHCSDKWLSRILDASLCSAGLIVVSGTKAAYALRLAIPSIPLGWGPPVVKEQLQSQERHWPKSSKDLARRVGDGTWTLAEQQAHTVQLDLYGKSRLLVWLPHPTGTLPRKIDNPLLINPNLIAQWREAAQWELMKPLG